ncbi:hypothetical protein B484DRAFT_426045, partial [Ochromonadaceae sp. CCMP2298]
MCFLCYMCCVLCVTCAHIPIFPYSHIPIFPYSLNISRLPVTASSWTSGSPLQ